MKDIAALIGLWAVAALLMLNLAATLMGPKSVLAQRDETGPGRYQIAAWASYTGGTTDRHGYYIIDTVTGRIFDKAVEEYPRQDALPRW